MKISTFEIQKKIDERFAKTYKAFGEFVDSGELWDECIAAVGSVTLMGHIIFCNNIHQIPPVHTFLRANRNIRKDLSETEKRSVGAFWGFVFKFVLGYRNQKSVTARVNTIKTASYFFDAPEGIEIIADKERGAEK